MPEPNESSDIARTAAAPSKRERTLVVAFRLLLLFAAAAAVAVAVFLAAFGRGMQGGAGARYVCPMHPEVTSAVPGECPICRMALEPIAAQGVAGGAAAIPWSTYLAYDVPRRRGYGPDSPSPAWVRPDKTIEAVLYDDELGAVTPGAHALFSPAQQGGAPVDVVVGAEPPRRWDRSTSLARFAPSSAVVPNGPRAGDLPRAGPEAALPAGEVGWLRMATKARELGVIPFAAVLEGVDGSYVLVASPDGKVLSRRSVTIGRVFGGLAFVLSGLRPQERVLVRNAFFVDAERRLRREPSIEVGQ